MIGSNDTSNDYTGDGDDEDYVCTDEESKSEPDLHILHQEGMNHHSFTDLAKKLEAQQLKNASTADRMEISYHEPVEHFEENLSETTPLEDLGFTIDNWLKNQNVGSIGRLTGSNAQKRKHQATSVSQTMGSSVGFASQIADEFLSNRSCQTTTRDTAPIARECNVRKRKHCNQG